MTSTKRLSSNVKRYLPVRLLLLAILSTVQPAIAQDAKVYACPPCPVDCHDQTFTEPGVCPHPDCGMQLIDRHSVRYVAIVVWQGAEILDFAGPSEVFASTRVDNKPAFLCYTVGITGEPITSQGFIKIDPEFSIDTCPQPDIIVLPGGGTSNALASPALIRWVKQAGAESEIAMSVCTGAFVLASAGLLDEKEATTYHSAIEGLRGFAPYTMVHEDQRWVDNGHVVTSAGVSAGIDASLHVVSRLHGKQTAQATADYMEYNWRPEQVTGKVVTSPGAPKEYTAAQRIVQVLLKEGTAAAFEARQALLEGPNAEAPPSEAQINNLGYRYLANGETATAITIFKFNTKSHPEAFNTFDSLGEAYMKAGQRDRAIKNYRKSLELNPDNAGAVEMLKKLDAE